MQMYETCIDTVTDVCILHANANVLYVRWYICTSDGVGLVFWLEGVIVGEC